MHRPTRFAPPLRVLALSLGSALGLATTGQAFTIITFDSRMEKASTAPTAADGPSATAGRRYAVSDDGCWVVFASNATNLVSGQIDGNLQSDVFLYQSCGVKTVRLVSHAFAAPLTTAGGSSDQPVISPDGTFVVFRSTAANIVPGSYTAGQTNIFLWNRVSDTFALVSHSFLAGNQGGNGNSQNAVISRTAANPFVAFESTATNLMFLDLNGAVSDVFRYNSSGGAVELVSIPNSAGFTDGGSFNPDISGPGLCVVYESLARNLVTTNVADDLNGGRDVFRWVAPRSTILLSHRGGPPVTTTQTGDGESTEVTIDDICERFAFKSAARNLVDGQVESNAGTDVFWAGNSGDAVLVSHRNGATSTTGFHPPIPVQPLVSYSPIISRDGQRIAYASLANDLSPGQADTGSPSSDVFIHLVGSGNTLVSHRATANRAVGNGESFAPEISRDGRYVAYESDATDLDPNQNDGNGARDVFLYNTFWNNSIMASPRYAALAIGGASQSIRPAISGEGYSVAFTGRSGDHIADDPETVGHDDVFLFNSVTLPFVPFISARSTSDTNTLEWIMPPVNYRSMQLRVNATSPCSIQFSDGSWSPLAVASPRGNTSALFTDPTLYAPGTTRCYGIFLEDDMGPIQGTDLPSRTITARTLEDLTGVVKWANNLAGVSALAQVGIGTQNLGAVANEGGYYALTRGSAGGFWPSTFWPFRTTLNPIQGRPPILPLSVLGSTHIAFVGSQDGRAYAIDANRGGRAGGAPWYTSPALGAIAAGVQGGAAGMFTFFGGVGNHVVFGGRTGLTSRFFALDPATGLQGPTSMFLGGGPLIGAINTSAAVDYDRDQVYFASHEVGGGPSLWCLELTATGFGSACWAQTSPAGISGGPVQRNGRVYVGDDLGQVWAFDATSGAPLWASPYTACGGGNPIKSFVLADRQGSAQDLYYATSSGLCAITDTGPTPMPKWSMSSIPGPSAPLLARIGGIARIYVGSIDGRLYQIEADNPAVITSVLLRTGATIGPAAFDVFDNMIYAGSDAGPVYAAQAPF